MVFIGIIGVIFLIDYFAKQKAEEELEERTTKKVANDKIVLQKLHNPGIAFGWFKGKENITVVGSAIAMGAMIISFLDIVFKKGKGVTKLGYAMIIGGGLNNLYERCMKGYVTDYFSFNVKFEKLKRLVFNISDMFILVGAVLVVFGKLFGNKDQ